MVHMAENIREERLRWVVPLAKGEIAWDEVMKVCPYGKRTLERWLAAYRNGGPEALEPVSTRPKTNPDETPIELKERVVALRKQTKLCALKLHWRLEKEGVSIHERTIGKLLKALGFSHISARPRHPKQDGEVIQAFKKTSPARSLPTSQA